MSNKFPFLVFVLGFVMIFSPALCADNGFPQLKVVPWNGHKAATSLTFDDNDPIHLDFVIPELNRRNLHATFFIIANKVDRKDEWRQAIKAGQELGNHTLDHLHATALTPAEENSQVVGAQNVLQKEFGVPFYSFAYPFSEAPASFKSWVEKTSFIARGGAPEMTSPDQKDFDWFNIPAKVTMTDYPFETYKGWIDEDLMYGDWLVWMIHGVEGTPWGWQPVPKKIFLQVLDYLQSKDIWVGTFTEIGSYLRAQKSFEASTSKMTGVEALYTWVIPEHCPPNVTLKVTLPKGNSSFELWQKGQKVLPDAQGNYSILFNVGELTLRPKQG
jgi:peptidoglycan/xylan/chitin deacetylase (PgdA/CDA1 family)